jgi:hypothetical protein
MWMAVEFKQVNNTHISSTFDALLLHTMDQNSQPLSTKMVGQVQGGLEEDEPSFVRLVHF